MENKDQIYLRAPNGKKLYELLPLDTPLSIYVDVSNLCNFQCSFCPTGDKDLLKSVNRSSGLMELDLFRKIIDDIANFNNKLENLHLYKDGEPLLNKNTVEMIKYAKLKDIAYSVETTTNGALLEEYLAIELIESGLDKIRISVEHINNEGYKSITKTFDDFNKIRKNVEFLYKEKEKRKSSLKIHVKTIDTNLSEKDKEFFLKTFSGISDSINIDILMGWSSSDKKDFTLGNEAAKSMSSKTMLKKDRIVCSDPFKTMAINFNGDVSICCVDWAYKTTIGNIKKENLVSIWNGTKINEFRLLHLQGKRNTLAACANCHYMLGRGDFNDLDKYKNEILKFYR